ncbi:MAG: hypothetical protein FVQ80_01530 [Planctomycetes bacterium]|nr:hypothetical protein [Planctomycetota bacterium]
MTHETLIQLVLGSHAAILGSAFLGFIRFSSFSSSFRDWRNDIEETLKSVKRTLAINLGEKLKPILENAGTTTINILDSGGNYCEAEISPTAGESYRNTLFDFINDKAHEMARYRSLLLAHEAYSFWASYLSCTIIILMVVEFLTLAIIGYFGILNGENISDLLIILSFSISGIGVIVCFFGLIFLLINHNKGLKNRGCHD